MSSASTVCGAYQIFAECVLRDRRSRGVGAAPSSEDAGKQKCAFVQLRLYDGSIHVLVGNLMDELQRHILAESRWKGGMTSFQQFIDKTAAKAREDLQQIQRAAQKFTPQAGRNAAS